MQPQKMPKELLSLENMNSFLQALYTKEWYKYVTTKKELFFWFIVLQNVTLTFHWMLLLFSFFLLMMIISFISFFTHAPSHNILIMMMKKWLLFSQETNKLCLCYVAPPFYAHSHVYKTTLKLQLCNCSVQNATHK